MDSRNHNPDSIVLGECLRQMTRLGLRREWRRRSTDRANAGRWHVTLLDHIRLTVGETCGFSFRQLLLDQRIDIER